ncbi:unnamed protein product [Rotaria sp. Silwood1]|nr:unnamed protein product [Rotaria sp. Silwood1]CAF3487561.1 unnamed protein product [Rotaria sp. Silwood1]CAF3490708.1 unnamed protein product [Rotaria sp. Silwood1]CAF4691528.1 unnamed protein product [Rotaria sp. Silwood1]CAF4980232.1 unnamed protein product [Rotaria sp. Silwood1]
MNNFFICKNGQNISWTFVCDGYNQCIDGSDERNCYCQGDVYACLQGNNVSCRIACATYGRVTCLTYQNIRACEQYIQEHSSAIHFDISSTSESFILTNDFDALRYSACLAMSILILVSILSILIYLIRKNPTKLLFSYTNKSLNRNLNRTSSNRLSSITQQQSSSLNLSHSHNTLTPNINDLPPSYDCLEQNSISLNDCYEPPPYPGPSLFSSVQQSHSTYYETIKTRTLSNSMSMLHPMLLPEPNVSTNIRTYCV